MMRFPTEKLDDFKSNAAAPTPPPTVWLHFTGETEVLQPLARYEGFVKSKAVAHLSPAPQRPSWFRRSLAASAALAVIALMIGTGLVIGLYRLPVEPVSPVDVAIDQHPAELLTPSEQSDESDILSAVDSPSAFDGVVAVRKAARPRLAPARVFQSVYRPRRLVSLPRPRLIVSNFVPTTLIIYIENGQIKTRIEPQLTAGYKKPSPLPD
jgi:hypothetical protein